MKLKVKRYNTRRSDPLPQPTAAPAAAPRPAAARPVPAQAAAPLRPAATPQAGGGAPRPAPRPPAPDDSHLFEVTEDGFGPGPFPGSAAAEAQAARAAGTDVAVGSTDMEAIRREGLTGRQLRMARRMAQKYGLPATSDFDAVRLLRQAGIDPFQKTSLLEVLAAEDDEDEDGATPPPVRAGLPVPRGDGVRLPQTIKPMKVPAPTEQAEVNHAAELLKIQQDLVRRRRRRSMLLAARLFFFVLIPGFLAGFYYYEIATPLYATKTEFVIQQADSSASSRGGGLGGLLGGGALSGLQDSIAVQGYLMSRDAMLRLDQDVGFRSIFQAEGIDPIQRLDPDATLEAAYKVYQRNVRIAYDPTEGIIKMEVIAPDPQMSVEISNALIRYAEEQVDQLTQRLREDQMKGARESYEEAEANMMAAQRRVVDLQERFKILSSETEVQLITAQISELEGQLTKDRLGLAQMESNETPNLARMEPLKRRIATLESEIVSLRSKLTEADASGQSLAEVQSELLMAEADVKTRQALLAGSLEAMESARVAANRQVRYLSLSVSPIAPDEAAYPRAFENTMVAFLIFAGIYLMISMTAAILREQVSA
jgi:capsular polysaccharide transport system permease protein